MAVNCGIIGLPNVGKSTIFSALTAQSAYVANYPFCTIEPNTGVVPVPDARLEYIAGIVHPEKIIPTVCEFVDIAGLVKGASRGEGLGNRFLSHIREIGVTAHVVRCFEENEVTHVHGKISPKDDIETVNYELALADLDTIERRQEKLVKEHRAASKEELRVVLLTEELLKKIHVVLSEGKPARILSYTIEEQKILAQLHLLTVKPVLYVCNIHELQENNPLVQEVQSIAHSEGAELVQICGRLEADIAALPQEEQGEFLKEMGMKELHLPVFIRKAYEMLGLRTFFTAGPQELRAWTFREGMSAPQVAGQIHSDFEKGFICADVYNFDDLQTYGSEKEVREAGKIRTEGKEYRVQDGDILFIKHNT